MNRLSEALRRADIDELEVVAEEIGQQAVQIALSAPVDEGKSDLARQLEHSSQTEAQRQRDLDAALADSIEVVNRHRARLGRKVCSRHDGETVRKVYELLRSVMGPDAGADGDPSFQ
jgi:hypothetical protein